MMRQLLAACVLLVSASEVLAWQVVAPPPQVQPAQVQPAPAINQPLVPTFQRDPAPLPGPGATTQPPVVPHVPEIATKRYRRIFRGCDLDFHLIDDHGTVAYRAQDGMYVADLQLQDAGAEYTFWWQASDTGNPHVDQWAIATRPNASGEFAVWSHGRDGWHHHGALHRTKAK